MRWRFVDPKNKLEANERSAVLAKIDAWWKEFASKTSEINALFSRKAEWDLPEWMEQHLQSIHPSIMWEYGPAVHGEGTRLVITPESRRDLRPLVRAIIQLAPKIEGWEFYEYRLPEGMKMVHDTVEARTGVNISDYQFRASRGSKHLIDLVFNSPQITQTDDQEARNAAFVALESLLGEQCLDNWIGAIEVSPLPRANGIMGLFGRKSGELPGYYPLERLKDTVEAVIGSIKEQLPPRPHYQWVCNDESINVAEWTLWELKPDKAEDYPEQQDIFVGRSVNQEQWTTAHSGSIFCSERFSRCGEIFVYIKLDGSQGLDQEGFADKSEIEDALNAVLKPEGLGCYMGGGTGLRYSYIDLALTDVDKAIPLIRKRLQEGKVPLRSWIQFFDSDLSAEWVGIYDETPSPPMVENDED